MNNVFIILAVIAVVTTIVLYISAKCAQEIKEEPPKFRPRQVTIIGKDVYTAGMDPIEVVKPKRKYKKRKPKQTIIKEAAPVKKPKISK